MIPDPALIGAAALAVLIGWRVRRVPARAASGGRLAAIAALVVVQAVLLDLAVLWLIPGSWRDGAGGIPGLIVLVQAARLLLLAVGFALWLSISRDDLDRNGRGAMLVVALLVVALTSGSIPVLGMAALIWVTGRPRWTQEFGGWRRALALVVGPALLALTTAAPRLVVEDGVLSQRWLPFVDPWHAALVGGAVPRPLEIELAFAHPLDRLVRALVDLFRAQLLVLTVRALTMPLRLYGMSLKRRFMLNHLFVRSVPSVLATLTLLVVGYVAFGMHFAVQARDAFERSLARADAVGAALLHDPRVPTGRAGAVDVLDAARAWVASDRARAHLALRRRDAIDDAWLAVSPGIPAALLDAPWPPAGAGRWRGILHADSALYLFAHRTEPSDTSLTIGVFVHLDSTGLAEVARAIGAGLTLSVDPGFTGDRGRLRLPRTGRPARVSTVTSDGHAPGRARSLFLGRSYLPLGDWDRDRAVGWSRAQPGALVLETRITPALLVMSLTQLPAWFYANVAMVILLVILTSLFGIIESIAVRSGRGVVRAIEEEVGALREAATRFGAGELGHRIPVRGRDELSALAGSFNEMAASLERQRAELVEKERLDEDLEVALAIQRRFLPQRAPSVQGLEVAGVSVPSREVGGDLFHYLELADARLALALGDVSGKSIPAALIMSNVMSALRAEVQHEAEVERSLERINRLLAEQIEPGRFVTLFYGIADPAAGRLRYTSAGHNPALRLTAGGEVGWLREGGVPLGVQPDSRYPSAEVPLERGDVVVVYSDGVTEAEGPERDGRIPHFGEEALARTVSALRAEPADAILAGVLDAVRGFAAGRPQADDITLVVLKRV